ncbi:MAG: hypothetical protein WKG03_11005 [Telluria sp.]
MTSAAHPPGKAGEFDFLSGHWRIAHRRLLAGTLDQWDAFAGEASCWSILNGTVSVEELRIPARNFSGMGLRVLDQDQQVWSDFWVNGAHGIVQAPGVQGYFEHGQGIFASHEIQDGQATVVRGLWDNISATACRWQQAISRDGGTTWLTNWSMDWVRVGS